MSPELHGRSCYSTLECIQSLPSHEDICIDTSHSTQIKQIIDIWSWSEIRAKYKIMQLSSKCERSAMTLDLFSYLCFVIGESILMKMILYLATSLTFSFPRVSIFRFSGVVVVICLLFSFSTVETFQFLVSICLEQCLTHSKHFSISNCCFVFLNCWYLCFVNFQMLQFFFSLYCLYSCWFMP